MNVLTRFFKKRLLDDALLVGVVAPRDGILVGAKVMLFTGAPALSDQTVLGDLVEPGFTGYARSAVQTWTPAFTDAERKTSLTGKTNLFVATDDATPATVTGYAVLDATAVTPNVLWAEMLAEPIPLTKAGDGVVIVPVLSAPPDGWGEGEMVG